MATFVQYIPSFCEGITRQHFKFTTFKELIDKQQELLPNHKWCYSDYGSCQLLMIETLDNTEWFVIGYVVDYDLSKDLSKVIYGD